MNYDFAKPNGFVSTKTLVGLASAGILSFAWWALHEDYRWMWKFNLFSKR